MRREAREQTRAHPDADQDHAHLFNQSGHVRPKGTHRGQLRACQGEGCYVLRSSAAGASATAARTAAAAACTAAAACLHCCCCRCASCAELQSGQPWLSTAQAGFTPTPFSQTRDQKLIAATAPRARSSRRGPLLRGRACLARALNSRPNANCMNRTTSRGKDATTSPIPQKSTLASGRRPAGSTAYLHTRPDDCDEPRASA